MASVMCLMLAGCDESGEIRFLQGQADRAENGDATGSSIRLVERDVEAPDVFQVTELGLWDGRPSLGGVWVAHPDVQDPERVIIRNTEDNNFVIGALFRRERETPGPALQISSDAAAALGILAGAPTQINVTALRRESAPEEVPDQSSAEDAPIAELEEPDSIVATSLDPIETASAAIDAAEAEEASTETAAASAPTPSSSLSRPYLQIGIFSVEQNAENAATAMRQAGMSATIREQSASGRSFWRVIVGPAASSSERAALLREIKGLGFEDAYAVSN